MNVVDRLISFIELAITTGENGRFDIKETESGYPLILDKENRIRVLINVDDIRITRYSITKNTISDDIMVPWATMTLSQKNRLIDILDAGEDLDPEIAETLEDILKGAF